MGQRLVITIKYGEKLLANAYYHWSGYTDSACEHTNKVLNFILENENEIKSKRLLAIRALEETGAGLHEYEKSIVSRWKKDCNFSDCLSRIAGILSITRKEMNTLLEYSEGDVIIDLKEGKVSFDVFYHPDEIDDNQNDVYALDSDLYDLDIEEAESVLSELYEINGNYFKLKDGTICGKI